MLANGQETSSDAHIVVSIQHLFSIHENRDVPGNRLGERFPSLMKTTYVVLGLFYQILCVIEKSHRCSHFLSIQKHITQSPSIVRPAKADKGIRSTGLTRRCSQQ